MGRRPAVTVAGAVSAVAAAAVLVVLSVLVATDASLLDAVDVPLDGAARAVRSPGLTSAASVGTWLGSGAVLVPLSVVVAAGGWAGTRSWWPGAAVALAGTGAHLSAQLVKGWLHRARPADGLVHAGGWSFPSGHAASSAAWWLTAATVLLWCAGARWRRRRRAAVWALGVLVAVVVGATRVYLGVHHASDVLAGWSLGALWAFLVMALAAAPTSRRAGAPVPRRAGRRGAPATR